MREIDIATICLPILGAGGIGLRAEDVVGPILDGSLWALTNIKETNRICFVDIDREKAHAMSGAMDDVLGRVKLTIAKGEDAERLRGAVSRAVDKAEAIDSDIRKIALEIRAAIKPDGRSVQVGNAGRQLSEYILQQILPASASRALFDRIEEAIPLPSADRIDNLRESPAASWMNGYFHLLRVLGNETSHHKESNRVPKAIEDKDLMVIMFAIERVLGFWIAWRTHQAASAASATEPSMSAR